MFAVDTSTLIAFFAGDAGKDIAIFEASLRAKNVYLPPVVLTEILSDTQLDKVTRSIIQKIPTLLIDLGYWERAGAIRAKLLNKRLKARLADTLIAQSCIDYSASLITRDADFRHFAKYCGLKIIG